MWGFLTRYRKKLARSGRGNAPFSTWCLCDASVGHSRWHIWSTTGSCTCSSPLQLMSLYHTPFRVTIIGLLVTSETMILYFYIHRTSYFIYSACLVCRKTNRVFSQHRKCSRPLFWGVSNKRDWQAYTSGIKTPKIYRYISSGMMNIVLFTHGEKKPIYFEVLMSWKVSAVALTSETVWTDASRWAGTLLEVFRAQSLRKQPVHLETCTSDPSCGFRLMFE